MRVTLMVLAMLALAVMILVWDNTRKPPPPERWSLSEEIQHDSDTERNPWNQPLSE